MWKILQTQTFFSFYIVYVLAFDEIYVNGQDSHDMIEKGKIQYQLLRERGTLPKYGNCWKSAVEHLEEGCRNLSEESQSDIALHITNCFLTMSGHQTYNCELDKKPNLRGICINSMTDRAFNVYTEFYTHTQNMCWFLRAQIWQETMAENTLKVGKQLEASAKNQENLLKTQKESLLVQEKMIEHGKFISKIMEDLYISSEVHKEILQSMRAWLMGEVSCINTIIFYVFINIVIMFLTSTSRTSKARFPLLLACLANCILERFVASFFSNSESADMVKTYSSYGTVIWFIRYVFISMSLVFLMYNACYYRDLIEENFEVTEKILAHTHEIRNYLRVLYKNQILDPNIEISLVNEHEKLNNSSTECKRKMSATGCHNSEYKTHSFSDRSSALYEVSSSVENGCGYSSMNNTYIHSSSVSSKENFISNLGKIKGRKRTSPLREVQNTYSRYNLRTRSVTPDLHNL